MREILIDLGISKISGRLPPIFYINFASKKAKYGKEKCITILFMENGIYDIDGIKTDLANLEQILIEQIVNKDPLLVKIHIEAFVSRNTLNKIMDIIHKAVPKYGKTAKKIFDENIKILNTLRSKLKTSDNPQNSLLDINTKIKNIEPVHIANPDRNVRIAIKIIDNDVYEINGIRTNSADFIKVLKEQMVIKNTDIIDFSTEPDVTSGAVIDMMKIIKKAGVKRIILRPKE